MLLGESLARMSVLTAIHFKNIFYIGYKAAFSFGGITSISSDEAYTAFFNIFSTE